MFYIQKKSDESVFYIPKKSDEPVFYIPKKSDESVFYILKKSVVQLLNTCQGLSQRPGLKPDSFVILAIVLVIFILYNIYTVPLYHTN